MSALITIHINEVEYQIAPAMSVAAAIAYTGDINTRSSVTGANRAAVCGMGICQECRVTINERAHQLACQTICVNGMQIKTTSQKVEHKK
jgi:succinate dehydrogenase/fumarate reductase-like Fe-S protein